MLDQVFFGMLNMSFTASIVIVIIICVRLCFKKLPKIYSYVLWSIVFIRLICPFTLESVLSILPVKPEPISEAILYDETPSIHTGIPVIDQYVSQSLPPATPEVSINPMQVWAAIGQVVWLVGIGIMVLHALLGFIKLRRRVRLAIYDETNDVYLLPACEMAFVLGLVRPKIYLPTELSAEETAYILCHERMHIKRFDPIIRLMSYLLVCIHWFNPLIWIAFYLSGKDMEMSCDELVIRQMGDGVKKKYATSLLNFSARKTVSGLTPLAFGEHSTMTRIKNVLAYKKPKFWIISVAVGLGLVIGVGLLTNPITNPVKEEQLSSVDEESTENVVHPLEEPALNEEETLELPLGVCAEVYLSEIVKSYDKMERYQIVDSFVESLEEMGRLEGILEQPIELWRINYRLKPDKPENVILTDGELTKEGYITEEGDLGAPVLVVEVCEEGKRYKRLGILKTGMVGETLSEKELITRQLLESTGVLEKETFKSIHHLVRYIASTGETYKLLLSQPAKQGEGGIWCVERYMDGNGTVYYPFVQEDQSLKDYYSVQQMAYDNGELQILGDPEAVGLQFTNYKDWTTFDQLGFEFITEATLEDFYELPISTYFGYILMFEKDETIFHFDRAQWLTLKDESLLDALGLTEADLPNGFYIYNPKVYPAGFSITSATRYTIYNPDDTNTLIEVNQATFEQYLKTDSNMEQKAFWVDTEGEKVTKITEQYLP